MLRIIILIGNIGALIFLIFVAVTNIGIGFPIDELILLFSLMLLCILNIYFIIRSYPGYVSLYLKRKKLEEEIKIQEAENKLKGLQSQAPEFLEEKNKSKII